MDFDLPIISGDAHPEFADASACAEWLERLPLINVGPAHGRLLGQLEELNCFQMPAAERIKILELLREPVVFVQSEHAKKFSGRAVPLLPQEREIFDNVLALWDALGYGWQHCMHALVSITDESTSQELRGSAALICQRSLWCVSQKIAEHCKAYRGVPEEEWRRLHRFFALAENQGVAGERVSHPGYKEKTQITCTETYAQVLLLELANPNEQTPRQQFVVSRCIERWAKKATISQSSGSEATAPNEAAALSVDLESGSGASRTSKQGAAVRYIDVEEVSVSIKRRLALLRSGEPPEALGLGADIPAALVGPMLNMLYRQWCEDKTVRQAARRVVARSAQLCSGLATIHYHLTGQAFRQPDAVRVLTQHQREEIATFGRVSERAEQTYVATHVTALEQWELCDENLAGFHLARPENRGSSRYTHQQLVAVRPSDARTFILGTVRWLSVSKGGLLSMGTRVIPGVPQGVAIRPTGVNAQTEKFIPALALPAVPALQSPPALILPSGWYRAKRVIELYTDRIRQVMLSAALERGLNYERCTFEPVE